jgi:hypothetical protein
MELYEAPKSGSEEVYIIQSQNRENGSRSNGIIWTRGNEEHTNSDLER